MGWDDLMIMNRADTSGEIGQSHIARHISVYNMSSLAP